MDPVHAGEVIRSRSKWWPPDGESESVPYRTAPVLVVNTPPIVSHVTVEADASGKVVGLLPKVDAVDPDRDEIHYTYRWWQNDKQVKEGEEGVLDTNGFGRKDVVVVEVTARDQEETPRLSGQLKVHWAISPR